MQLLLLSNQSCIPVGSVIDGSGCVFIKAFIESLARDSQKVGSDGLISFSAFHGLCHQQVAGLFEGRLESVSPILDKLEEALLQVEDIEGALQNFDEASGRYLYRSLEILIESVYLCAATVDSAPSLLRPVSRA